MCSFLFTHLACTCQTDVSSGGSSLSVPSCMSLWAAPKDLAWQNALTELGNQHKQSLSIMSGEKKNQQCSDLMKWNYCFLAKLLCLSRLIPQPIANHQWLRFVFIPEWPIKHISSVHNYITFCVIKTKRSILSEIETYLHYLKPENVFWMRAVRRESSDWIWRTGMSW